MAIVPSPHLIEPEFHARVWGSLDLRAWYPDRPPEKEPIGEAWLSPLEGPVLIKLLFPHARLSVQVHPDDAYAAEHHLGRGKTEAWYVVEAAPDARLGIGLRAGARWEEFGPACRAGRGAEMLDWQPVETGDVLYIPAGTIHAIGPGMVLLEVQQPSDVTFRLDDYNRGRELHLKDGLAVARATDAGRRPRSGKAASASGGEVRLDTPYFRMLEHQLEGEAVWTSSPRTRWLVNLTPGPAKSIAAHQDGSALPRGKALEIPPHCEWRWSPAGEGPHTVIELQTGDAAPPSSG